MVYEVFGVFFGKIIIQAIDFNGGGYRNRTGVHGFAIRCITTLPTRLNAFKPWFWGDHLCCFGLGYEGVLKADRVICGVIVFFTALVQSAIVLFGGGGRILFRGLLCSLPYAGKALGPFIALFVGDFGEEVFRHGEGIARRAAGERLGEVFGPERVGLAHRLAQGLRRIWDEGG